MISSMLCLDKGSLNKGTIVEVQQVYIVLE